MRTPHFRTGLSMLYVLIGGIQYLHAQNTPATIPNVLSDHGPGRYKHVLKANPLKLIDLSNPALELSYERAIGQHFAAEWMASYLLPFSVYSIGQEPAPETKGYRLSMAGKYYYRGNAPAGGYLALELDHLRNRYRDEWDFGPPGTLQDSSSSFLPDTYTVSKRTFSLNLKFGYQFIEKRMSFDLFAGIGVRYRDVVHTDRTDPDHVMRPPYHPIVPYLKSLPGQYWAVSIPMGFRLGWAF